MNARFAKFFLESTLAKSYFKLAAHGGTMEILNLAILKSLPVPLPPLAEQQRIVAEVERRLSIIEEVETVVRTNLKRAATLRQRILQHAFTGKLVAQDPTDEPASVLLERIKEERSAISAQRSVKRAKLKADR